MSEFYDEYEAWLELRQCNNSCSHYDNLNQCCWQAGDWGLCFDVIEGDTCRLRYKEAEG